GGFRGSQPVPGTRNGWTRRLIPAACLLKPECYSHLIAGVLPRAAGAIGPHLQGELLLLGGPEAQAQEEHRLLRQREDLGEAERTGVVEQRGDERAPHALPLLVLADRERRQLGELGAVDLERHGPDDPAAPPPPPPPPPRTPSPGARRRQLDRGRGAPAGGTG